MCMHPHVHKHLISLAKFQPRRMKTGCQNGVEIFVDWSTDRLTGRAIGKLVATKKKMQVINTNIYNLICHFILCTLWHPVPVPEDY